MCALEPTRGPHGVCAVSCARQDALRRSARLHRPASCPFPTVPGVPGLWDHMPAADTGAAGFGCYRREAGCGGRGRRAALSLVLRSTRCLCAHPGGCTRTSLLPAPLEAQAWTAGRPRPALGSVCSQRGPDRGGHARAWGGGSRPITCTSVCPGSPAFGSLPACLKWAVSPCKYLMTAMIADKGLLCSQRERDGDTGTFWPCRLLPGAAHRCRFLRQALCVCEQSRALCGLARWS